MRHWGGDEVIGSFLPGLAALLLPPVVVACLPRRADRPFLLGLKDAIWPRDQPARPALPLERRLRVFRTARGIAAGSSAACLASGIVAAWLSRMPGAQPAGSPLPAMTLTALSAPGTVLPAYASIVGATAQHGSAWEHRETLRRTLISDLYIPLTAAGWRPGDPIDVLQLERAGVAGQRPGPPEGALSRGVPAWLLASMREAGIAVTGGPVVLTRQALGGVAPASDGVAAVLSLIIGGATAALFGTAALSFHLAGRRLAMPAGR